MNQIQQFIEYITNAIKIWVIVQPWESGLRVRCGNRIKPLSKGIYFKLPYFDSVYVQEVRLRVRDLSVQTLTSKDGKTITLSCSMGYSISNVQKLYETLYHPEQTLSNIAMSELAQIVFSMNAAEVTPELIERKVLKKLSASEYGLRFEYFKVNNFAVVRTYRLIQDHTWSEEGLKMTEKK